MEGLDPCGRFLPDCEVAHGCEKKGQEVRQDQEKPRTQYEETRKDRIPAVWEDPIRDEVFLPEALRENHLRYFAGITNPGPWVSHFCKTFRLLAAARMLIRMKSPGKHL
jgi:hypothetical protein